MKIDLKTGAVTYNTDYAPVFLLSHFIRPGDQLLRVNAPGKMESLAVRNRQRLVVFLQNDAITSVSQNIELAASKYSVAMPAQSLSAFVFKSKD